MNKKIIIKIINAIFFLLVLTLTFYVIFKKNDITIIINNIKKVNIFYILIGILCMFIYVLSEGINIRRVLKTLDHKITLAASFKYASVGFFFSAITPSATGGDPVQLYFMKKDKLPVSHSALSLLIELLSFEIIACILAIFGFLYNYNTLIKIGNMKFLIFIGIFLNIVYITILLILIFSKTAALKIENLICKMLNFFHYKKTEKLHTKFIKLIEEYHKCSIHIKNNKNLLLKTLFTTLIELTIYHSITYFIYLSLGLNSTNIISFITISAVLYTSVACIPFPGAMGISEGSFMILFKILFPGYLLSTGMLMTRAVSFYLFVIITGLITLISYIINNIKKKNLN